MPIKTILKTPAALIFSALLMLAFSVGVHMHGYSDFHYAPVNLLIIAAMFIGLIGKRLELPTAPPAIMLLIFWSFITLSLSWSSVQYSSILSFCIFSSMPLTFFAITLSPRREDIIKAGTILLGFSLILLNGWAIYQYFITGSDYGYRAHHPLLNPNNLAAILNMGAIPALTAFFYAKEKSHQYITLGLSAFMIAGLLATGSRGALISTDIATLTILLFSYKKVPQITLTKFLWLVGVSSLLMAIFYFGNQGSAIAKHLLSTFTPASDASFNVRLATWQSALDMGLGNFWTGSGFGTFYEYFPAHRVPIIDTSSGHWAHMDSLQFFVELGILAPLLFYGLLISVLIYTIKALKTNSSQTPYIWASFGSLLTLAIHSHFTFNLYILGILTLSGFIMAAWYVFASKALGQGYYTPQPKFQTTIPLAVIASFALMIGYMSFSSASGAWYLQKAQHHKSSGDIKSYLTALSKSNNAAPISYIEPEIKMIEDNLLMLQGDSKFDRQKIITETAILLTEAARWNPARGKIDYLNAELQFLQGNKSEAEKLLIIALSKNPQFFKTNRMLSNLYMSQGNVEKALAVLEKAAQYPHSKIASAYYKKHISDMRNLLNLKQQYINKKKQQPE